MATDTNYVSDSRMHPAMDLSGLGLDDQGELIGLNDDRGYTFAKIADWIEANVAEAEVAR